MEKPTEAELQFYYYMRGTSGNGVKSLITAIFALDLENRAKIALGFPELVDICNRYNNESGFYDKLLTKINNYYATGQSS
jgi:hypothetical protein